MQVLAIDFKQKLTPSAIFSAVREKFGRPCTLLESLSFDEKNKMSIIASCPVQELITSDNSFEKIREKLKKCKTVEGNFPFEGGLIGYFNFEIFNEIEPKYAMNSQTANAIFYEFSRFVFFDHEKQKIVFISTNFAENFEVENNEIIEKALCYESKQFDLDDFRSDKFAGFDKFDSEQNFVEFAEKINIAKKKIFDGEVFQIIVSNQFKRNCFEKDGLDFYEILRVLEPTTHLFLLDFAEHGQVVGASPEILGSKRGDAVLYRPIAGTRSRGKNEEEDAKILAKMKKNIKENAEHDMLLDLGRNDLGRICKAGSIRVSQEKYGKLFANVMHLVSDLTGEIDSAKFDAVDFFKAIFPIGTLTGAPKIRAVEVIHQLEKVPRELYGGAVGYFSVDGNMEFAIAIRSFFLKNGEAKFRVGAGVVQDSVAEDEWLEIHNKAKSLVKVFNSQL